MQAPPAHQTAADFNPSPHARVNTAVAAIFRRRCKKPDPLLDDGQVGRTIILENVILSDTGFVLSSSNEMPLPTFVPRMWGYEAVRFVLQSVKVRE